MSKVFECCLVKPLSMSVSSSTPVKINFRFLSVAVNPDEEKDMVSYKDILDAFYKRKTAEAEAGLIIDPKQPLLNAQAALSSFKIMLHLDSPRVGSEFLSKFENNLQDFKVYLRDVRRISDSSVKNNISIMRNLKAIYDTLCAARRGEKYGTLSEEIKRLQAISGLTLAEISTETKVPIESLKRIARGAKLKPEVGRRNLAKIENLFIKLHVMNECDRRSLEKIAIFEGSKTSGYHLDQKNSLSVQVAESLSIQKNKIHPDNILKKPKLDEIDGYLKSCIGRVVSAKRASDSWKRTETESSNNSAFKVEQSGKEYVTSSADIFWANISAYIAFIVKTSEGQRKYSDVTIIDLLSVDNYRSFSTFLSDRRDGCSGQAQKHFRSALRTLLKSVEKDFISASLNNKDKIYRISQIANIKELMSEKISFDIKTRNYRDIVDYFLNLNPENPMGFFHNIVKGEYARCQSLDSSSALYLETIRNAVALAILCVCPLRVRNLQELTYTASNTGSFFFDDSRQVYMLKIPANRTKNRKPILFSMPKKLNPLFDDYINLARQNFLDINALESKFLFVNVRNHCKGQQKKAISGYKAVKTITGLYVPGGLNPHFFRHMGASAILIKKPGQWELAASLLDDKVATIMGAYGHISERYTKKRLSDEIDSSIEHLTL